MTGTDLQTRQDTAKSSLPIVPHRDVVDLTDRLTSRIQHTPDGKGEIVSTAAPTEAERGALEVRRNTIADLLEPARELDIEKAVAHMLAQFGGPERDANASRALVRTVALQLRAFPLWAIHEACQRILGGRAPGINMAFAPQPPQIAHLCREIVQVLHSERARIAKVLDATVFHEATPEERARVAAGLAGLVEEIKAVPDKDREAHKELMASFAASEARMRERELRKHGIEDGLPMSLALRTKLGLVQEGIERTRQIEAMRERRMYMEDDGEDPRGA